jgi:serine/threonine-protein kinase
LEAGSLGRYRLIDLLGEGGMGQVYRAYDSVTNRTVALKVLPPHLAGDPGFQQRFVREANTIAALTEPHIVPIHGFGEIDGHLYVDMRLIEGRDLGDVLRHGPLSPARAVGIIEQVAAALDAAHHAGLVHRDVKPSNILLTNSEFAYLIDFGIAWAADSPSLTGTGNMIGTWQYMAPERFGSGRIDGRSDTYSLACVLYECLTGDRPYPGSSVEQQVAGHLSAPPPRPSTAGMDVPMAFDDVIAGGMAKDPDDRYPTVLDFARAARAACVGDSIPSAPAPVPTTVQAPFPPPAPNHPAAPQLIGYAPPTQVRPPAYPTPWQGVPSSAPRSRRKPLIIGASLGAVLVVVIAIVLSTSDFGGSSTTGTQKGAAGAGPAAVLSASSKLAAAATSAHYVLDTTGKVDMIPPKVGADITTVPAKAAKGTLTLTLLGQTITNVDFVDLTSGLYMALTPNNWTQYGPTSDTFDFLPAGLLDPDTGIAKLLSTATDVTGGSTTNLDGRQVAKIDAKLGAQPVNQIFPNATLDLNTVPTAIWIASDTGEVAKIQLELETGRSISIAFSKWNTPVSITKPV